MLAGDLPPGGTANAFPANGLGGAQLSVFAAQRVKALPEVGARGVLVNYEIPLARLGGVLPDRARLSVWLADPRRRPASASPSPSPRRASTS